jgi:hypothetical protein
MAAAAPGFSCTGQLSNWQEDGPVVRLAFPNSYEAGLVTDRGISTDYRVRSGGLPGAGETINLAFGNTEYSSEQLTVLDRVFCASGSQLLCVLVVQSSNVPNSKIAASFGLDDATRFPGRELRELQHVAVHFGFPGPIGRVGQLVARAGVPEKAMLESSLTIPAVGDDIELQGKSSAVWFSVSAQNWYMSDLAAVCHLSLKEKMISVSHLPGLIAVHRPRSGRAPRMPGVSPGKTARTIR